MKQSIDDEVTQAIIANLEKGVKPWNYPWQKSTFRIPTNLKTGNPYRGINVLNLWMKTQKQGFTSKDWVTFRQASELNHTIKQGEHGTKCLYFKLCEYKLKKDASNEQELHSDQTTHQKSALFYPMPKIFYLFNLNQLEGMDVVEEPILTNPIEQAEALIKASSAKIIYGREAAFFRHSSDEIYMPTPQKFSSLNDYYATLLHELIHWTGHDNRLHRSNSWVSKPASLYAGEELVAELGSAFLCADLGIKGEIQHASYIDSWLRLFRDDKRAIFKAAALAQQAFDYLKSLQLSQTGLPEVINARVIA